MSLTPASRPRLSSERTRELLDAAGDPSAKLCKVRLLGVRGYYFESAGEPDRNDRGIYDDALILDTPSASITFNANVDPSVFRQGIATLKTGLWWYKLGTHGLSKPKAQQYEALVQAGEVTVTRDGGREESGWFGINIHRGGISGTSSLGCQTLPREQWEAFINLVRSELKRHGQKRLPYLLIQGPV